MVYLIALFPWLLALAIVSAICFLPGEASVPSRLKALWNLWSNALIVSLFYALGFGIVLNILANWRFGGVIPWWLNGLAALAIFLAGVGRIVLAVIAVVDAYTGKQDEPRIVPSRNVIIDPRMVRQSQPQPDPAAARPELALKPSAPLDDSIPPF